jgi:hypothetical protein
LIRINPKIPWLPMPSTIKGRRRNIRRSNAFVA